MFHWYYQWYLNILFNNKSDFSGILNGTLEYRTIPLDYSMVKRVSMVLSMVSEHTFQQYIILQWFSQWYLGMPLDHSMITSCFSGI